MKKTRLTKKQLKRIIKLIKRGNSLNQISKLTDKSKTTIYYYYRKIKGKINYPIKINTQNKELIGEFIGLFAGDGCIYKTLTNYNYRTYLCFNVTEKEFVENLINNVLIRIFGKRPSITRRENRLNLCYYSKSIHYFISDYLKWNKNFRKTYSVELKSEKHSKDFLIGFIRGCLDSDGHFSDSKINFATVSPGLAKNMSNIINKFDIQHSLRLYKEKRENRKDIYHINVSRLDHSKFIKLINPRNK